MSECRYGSGDIITAADLKTIRANDCIIERGAVIRLYYNEPNTIGSGSGIVPLLASQPRHHRQAITMEEEASGILSAPASEPAPAVATVGQPEPAVDLAALSQAAGGNSTLTVLLALIAVLFGAAGWKFWQKVSGDHHEYRMKELELKAEAAKAQQHQQCATVHAQHDARLTALEQKVTAVETNTASFDADFDAGDLKKRLVKLEKALKAKPK